MKGSVTVKWMTTEAVPWVLVPSPVTVSVTLGLPPAVNVCVTEASVKVVPSPKSQQERAMGLARGERHRLVHLRHVAAAHAEAKRR